MSKSISAKLVESLPTRTGTVITEREMNALKKRWGPFYRAAKGVEIEQYAEAEVFEESGPFLVSIGQTAKGLGWWKKMVFTPSGEVRKTAFVRENLNEYRIDILRNFDRFEFVDWEFIGTGYQVEWPHPVYRVVAKNGDAFRYAMRSWQSGSSIVE